MKRIIVAVVVFLLPLSTNAGLHPGWQQSGWLTDLASAQQQAKKSGRPLFLYFDAIWCSWCQQYKRTTLDKRSIRNKLNRDFVPLVIDYDADPGLFNQLGGRGLPFSVILSPDGRVLNRFVGVLSETDLLATLEQFSAPSASTPAPVAEMFEPVTVSVVDAESYQVFRQAFLRHIESLYSEEDHTLVGQYQTGATLKRPSPLTWMWLMRQPGWQRRANVAAKVEAKRLADPVAGGFFQYLHAQPVSPDYIESSKLLEVNARLSQWLARAAQNDRELLAVARAGVGYLRSTLRDHTTGAFFQAQIADQAYYQLPPAQRSHPPAIDRIIRMDTNAQAVIALIDLSQQLDEPQLLADASRAHDFLLAGMKRNGRYYHLFEANELKVAAQLADLFWLYAAGLELQRVQADGARQSQLLPLAHTLRERLDRLMSGQAKEFIEPSLYGLIAWIATHPLRDAASARLLGPSQAHWALRQMKLEADTPPDTIIYGLEAWARLTVAR